MILSAAARGRCPMDRIQFTTGELESQEDRLAEHRFDTRPDKPKLPNFMLWIVLKEKERKEQELHFVVGLAGMLVYLGEGGLSCSKHCYLSRL